MPDDDLEKYFTQSEKHMEIERVLGSFKLDPFAILELPYGEPDSNQVKKQYRKKSLMIHPDKVKHERAEEAFNLLKKAESELNDENRVRFLLGVIEEAKVETLREHGYKVKTQVVAKTDDNEEDKRPKTIIESNEEQYSFLKTDEGQKAMQSKVKALLIEMELRRRRQLKMEMEAEGAEKRKAEEEAILRKRKQEEAKQWEATRDQRVNSWRDFQKKGGRKVKKIKRSGA